MFGFRLHAFNDMNHKMAKCAKVFAIVNTKSPTRQLITDLLLCAKQEHVDLLETQQYGLTGNNFENLLVYDYQYEYWHIYNYSYPEVDEERCCVFCSSLEIGMNKCIFEPAIATETRMLNRQFKKITRDQKPMSKLHYKVYMKNVYVCMAACKELKKAFKSVLIIIHAKNSLTVEKGQDPR